ncbi:MAG: chromosome segregation SMC family protein [Actinomycetota bacterium]
MFLKSLTLKGFKSFADKTTLQFEPGVTVVVGPNGTGKSNLVDAVAWVLGAQGPRTLRGGKMDDVIFAGAPGRPALGRAEVSLTIDNDAGLLPIDFSEVTITRTIFRNTGESEYALNGAPCRLLDIQELLSDTGIGRQQHVIVGQGQIDTVLTARPEERRAIIEEAAAILKFRRRRERAERRLEATEGNLLRLNDLVREVSRQLTPLQKQADAARRHGGLVDELRAIRLYLAGHEIGGLQARLERVRDQRAELEITENGVRLRLRELDTAVLDVEHSLTALGHDDLADWLVRVESLRERARGVLALVEEKHRGVDRELTAAADQGVVETLVADAVAMRRELEEVDAEAAGLGPRLAEVEEAERQVAGERGGGVPDDMGEARSAAEDRMWAADERWRQSEAEAARWRARADALALSLGSVRAESGAQHLDGLDGIAGLVADHLEIETGTEAAVAAALGDAMRAVVVEGGDAARDAVELLAGATPTAGAGALLLVIDASLSRSLAAGRAIPDRAGRPAGTRSLGECVRAGLPGLQAALDRLLAHTVLVESGWQAALDVALEHPGLVAVTPEGDRLGGATPWRLGGGEAGTATQAALEEAEQASAEAEVTRAEAEAEVAEAAAALAAVRASQLDVDETRLAERRDLDERAAAAATLRRDLEVRAATLEERRTLLARRLEGVEGRLADRDPEAHASAERQRSGLLGRAGDYEGIVHRLRDHLAATDALHDRLRARRRRQSEAARTSGERLDALRTERAGLEEELAGAREKASRAEIQDAETRMRLEAAVDKLRADFDCEPAAALDAAQPEVPEGTTLAGRARELERELRIMGPINPLALQEFDALEERHSFLQQQLDDVKASRRDLARVIRAVDREIVTVFEAAFDDVSERFGELFQTLFPGGSGRLTLTDPDDLLNTGIEIEARPSGKHVRRLSLLSGGERSLTALAYLFAVFRARPSPFYLLDEVEAALDDVNLHRFLDLVHEFREEAQLVVVTHQKRTMEAADVLYGVSMPPGGSSKVVSERISDELVSS